MRSFRQSVTPPGVGIAAVFILTCLMLPGCRVQAPEADETYAFRVPSADGIGKVYMGREIARVMGHEGADWLDRASRSETELPDRVLDALQPDSAATIADIGAGTGFFTFRLARRVPRGKVLAVDIQPEMLRILEARSDTLDLDNVEPVLGTEQDPNLPAARVDLILVVDSYHEFSYPREMAEAMMAALKPGGRLVLVEYRGEDATLAVKALHRMTEAQVRRELEAVGLRFRENLSVLPQQHLLIFTKPEA